MLYNLDITVPGFSLANAKQCALAARDAYDAPSAILARGAVVVASPVDGTQAVITDCGNCIVIAIQGTANLRQWITDAKAWRTAIKQGSVHAGFLADAVVLTTLIAAALSDLPRRPIFFLGHSLGGAQAQICAYRFNQIPDCHVHSVYTFGGPRVGNEAGVLSYGELAHRTFRVTNGADIVPWLPAWFAGYRHTKEEYFMPSTGGILNGPALFVKLLADLPEICREWQRGQLALLDDHCMQSYIDRLNQI